MRCEMPMRACEQTIYTGDDTKFELMSQKCCLIVWAFAGIIREWRTQATTTLTPTLTTTTATIIECSFSVRVRVFISFGRSVGRSVVRANSPISFRRSIARIRAKLEYVHISIAFKYVQLFRRSRREPCVVKYT